MSVLNIPLREIEGRSAGYYALLAVSGALTLAGLGAAYYMEHYGHIVTGMTNQIVWGVPHVVAVFLIVAASGVLNVASIASVFGRKFYEPLAPLAGLLAIALMAGGLAVLVLDLGRADRLIVALTHFNFKSIFALNVFLYLIFFVLVAIYLWTLMERRMHGCAGPIGFATFIWRLLLTTGTGLIFGFLAARQAYDSALLAPMFIVMSFSYGLAVYVLVLVAAYRASGRTLDGAVRARLARLLIVFAAATLYFAAVHHVTNFYVASQREFERFILLTGGVYPILFWGGQVALGGIAPIAILANQARARSCAWITTAAALVVLGALAQMYVTIIGGQAYPLQLFPGMQEASSFFDGVVHPYAPSVPEMLLGLGGIAASAVIVLLGVKLMPFLPLSLESDRLEALEARQSGVSA